MERSSWVVGQIEFLLLLVLLEGNQASKKLIPSVTRKENNNPPKKKERKTNKQKIIREDRESLAEKLKRPSCRARPATIYLDTIVPSRRALSIEFSPPHTTPSSEATACTRWREPRLAQLDRFDLYVVELKPYETTTSSGADCLDM